jgi:hypothetical protein
MFIMARHPGPPPTIATLYGFITTPWFVPSRIVQMGEGKIRGHSPTVMQVFIK